MANIWRRFPTGRLTSDTLYHKGIGLSVDNITAGFWEVQSSNTYTLVAQGGSYSINGQQISILHHKSLTANGGVYLLTGSNVSILRHRNLTAQSGVYTYTGQSVNITYIPSATVYTLTALSGTYTLSGQMATLLKHKYLIAGSGAYSVIGQDVTILHHRQLNVSSGSYTLNGRPATITWSSVGGAVWPLPSQVLLGTVYGPTGSEYTGTLDVLGVKYDISTGQLVKPINDKVVMTL